MEAIQKLYMSLEKKLEQVDFDCLWPGFRQYAFALYTDTQICLRGRILPIRDCFRGNTAITFEGEQIAIWKLDETEAQDPALLAAGIVHEMFHAFQLEQGETRFPDDLAGQDYPMDIQNLSIKLWENRMLAQALSSDSQDGNLDLLSAFCALRERRRAMIGEAMAYELLLETAEGMAEYIGTRALRDLDGDAFRRRVVDMQNRLEAVSPLQLDIRGIGYYSGTALLLAADVAGINYLHELAGEKQPVYELIRRQLPGRETPAVPVNDTLGELLRQRIAERRAVLNRFFSKAAGPVTGDFMICGYDPMNLFQLDGMLYGSHFWRLHDQGSQRDILLTGESVLRSTGGRRVDAYWTLAQN